MITREHASVDSQRRRRFDARSADGQTPLPYAVLSVVAFMALPALLTGYVVYIIIDIHAYAIDFHQEFWPAAQRVIHSLSPYAPGWQNIGQGVSFPYPALTALSVVPFALLPRVLADGLFTALNIGAVLLTLRVLDIRDWRLYGLVLVWSPVIDAWQAANLTLLLGLGIAVVWRERHRPIVAGLLVAVIVSLKPFAWPLALWLLATRRYAALGYAAVCGLTINLVAWSILGIDQLGAYESLTRVVTQVQYRAGYTIVALALRLGTGRLAAYAIGVGLAGFVALACLNAGHRRDDRRSLTLCISLCLLATPVLWVHYFALILVPLALARPRLAGLWFVPLVLWVCPVKSAPWQIAVALGVNAAVVVAMLRGPGAADLTLARPEETADLAARDIEAIPAPVGPGYELNRAT